MGSQNKSKRKELKKAFKRQKGKCHLCDQQMFISLDPYNEYRPNRATADHILPKSLGGPVRGNIAAACSKCNGQRGNMTVEEYRKLLGDMK